MPRPEKVRAVEEIRQRLENAEATFVTEYRGLTVPEQQALRRGLRAANGEFKVLKMSLARRAADELGWDELSAVLQGPTALAFADGDPVPVAKALRDFAVDHEALVLKLALFAGEVLPPERISKLADIEPREVLLSKIAGAAAAPLANLAYLLQALLLNSASVFSQLLDQKAAAAPEVTEVAEAPAEPAAAEEPPAEPAAEAPEPTGEEPPAEAAAGEEPAAESAAEVEEAPAEAAGGEEPPAESATAEVAEAPAEPAAKEEPPAQPAAEAPEPSGEEAPAQPTAEAPEPTEVAEAPAEPAGGEATAETKTDQTTSDQTEEE